MSPKNLRKLAHPELEISTVKIISVRKRGNEKTDRHTRHMKLFEINVKNIPGISPENLRKIANPELELSLIIYFQ